MNIIIIGGHLTPAYALAEYAKTKGDTLYLISSSAKDSIEIKELSNLNISYTKIPKIKLDRHHLMSSLLRLPLILYSIIISLRHLIILRANVVVGFGSYNAIPVCIAAYFLHIPIIIHEQTRVIGLANRLLIPLANKVACSFPDSTKYIPKSKLVISGNLIRQAIWNPPKVSPFKLTNQQPIIYITGGNQGSVAINVVISQIVNHLSNTYQVFWQYGLSKPRINLDRITAQSWFTVNETSFLLTHAHIIITRAGANTLSEIMVSKVPAIIIPLLNTSYHEQELNAELFSQNHAGIVIDQTKLTASQLLTSIQLMEKFYSAYQTKAHHLTSYQNPQAVSIFYQLCQHIGNRSTR